MVEKLELKRTDVKTIFRAANEFTAVWIKGWVWFGTHYIRGFIGTVFSAAIFYFLAQFIGPASSPHLQAYKGDYVSYVILGIGFNPLMFKCLGLFQAVFWWGEAAGRMEIYMTEPGGIKGFTLANLIQRILGASSFFILYLLVGIFFFGINVHGDVLTAFITLALACFALTCIGMIGAGSYVCLNIRDRTNPLMWISNILVGIVSGVYFPPEILPEPIRNIGLIFPQTYALEAGRLALIGGYGLADPTIQRDIIILLLYIAVFLPLGVLVIRRAFRKLEREGFLSRW